jgi:HD-GYP domain-containing protein (c-di-GMP phosphodiesterase class II)
VRGFEELCLRPDLGWGPLMMVYQHHERYDGRGYPAGLVGKEIHEWGRICAVADVYDALTRDRPYRKGADTKDVLEYMDRESGRSFDEEMCQCWIATLKQCQRQARSSSFPAR